MSAQDKKGFKFFIKGVRCFKEEAELHIRPLTFLTGENSTGKSTVLGCLRVLRDVAPPELGVPAFDFNQYPYQMGAFDNIARRVQKGPRSFHFGGIFPIANGRATIKITATFCKKEKSSSPLLESQKYELHYEGKAASLTKLYDAAYASPLVRHLMPYRLGEDSVPKAFVNLLYEIYPREKQRSSAHSKVAEGQPSSAYSPEATLEESMKEVERLAIMTDSLEKDVKKCLGIYHESFGPIGIGPERAYDPVKSQSRDQGMEDLVMLRDLAKKSDVSDSSAQKWRDLKEGIERFGKDAGMFEHIEIRELGKFYSDPFQVSIKVPGMAKANLIDVGHGVSQVIPLLTRVLARQEALFLLQQPENDLHPQGQAALTTFLIKHMKSPHNHRFVIETQSDHIIDRARIEVRRGNIAPEDVSIIYLESKRGHVKAHNLTLDERGHLQNTPRDYRDFFLNEAKRVLGFKKYL